MRLGAAVVLLMGLAVAPGCNRRQPQVIRTLDLDGETTGATANGAADGLANQSDGSVEGGAPALADGRDATGTVPERAAKDLANEGAPIPALATVYFEFDSDGLTPSAEATLTRNAAYLAGHEELQVVLRGHTDDQGTEPYNMSLGSRRAQVVRDFLVGKGIDAGRLETVSFGEMIPESDTSTPDQNRRVEFFVYTVGEE